MIYNLLQNNFRNLLKNQNLEIVNLDVLFTKLNYYFFIQRNFYLRIEKRNQLSSKYNIGSALMKVSVNANLGLMENTVILV